MDRLLRTIAGLIALSYCSLSLSAQTKKPIFYAISGSVDIGRFQDRVELKPTVAFRVLSKTYAGMGLSASYYSSENTLYNSNSSTRQSIVDDEIWYWGGELFVQFVPFENKDGFHKNCFLQTSVEILYGKGKYKDDSGVYNYNTNNQTLFTGLGYKQPVNDRFAIGLLLNFKINNESDSPYRNPMVRVSFEF